MSDLYGNYKLKKNYIYHAYYYNFNYCWHDLQSMNPTEFSLGRTYSMYEHVAPHTHICVGCNQYASHYISRAVEHEIFFKADQSMLLIGQPPPWDLTESWLPF